MKPTDQLDVLKKIWGDQEGYVFLPWSSNGGHNWHEIVFSWPKDDSNGKIIEHLKRHRRDDVYFTPGVFEKPLRKNEHILPERCLWADLDEIDPREFHTFLEPSIAWETSPGRYQCVWIMDSPREGASANGDMNQRVTYYVGADHSGWDSSQALRVPGCVNNKYRDGRRGKLLWDEPEHSDLSWSNLDSLIPEVKLTDIPDVDVSALTEDYVEGIDYYTLKSRVFPMLSSRVRGFMEAQDASGDRSEVLWEVERSLADLGLKAVEIVALIRPTVWNKFRNRNDELKQLFTEAQKAISKKLITVDFSEYVDEEDKPQLIWWQHDDEYINQPEPEWLVNEMIPRGGCGFIAGVAKSMKSYTSLYLAIALTSGKPFLEREIARPVNVMSIQQEDPGPLVLDRHKIIADSIAPEHSPSRTKPKMSPGGLAMVVQKGFDAGDIGWQAWLHETITANNIELVVIDTLATVSGGVDLDKSAEAKGRILDPLKRIARKTNCAILLVHHNTKSGDNSRAGQNMAGSGQIHAWTDFGIFAKEKNNKNELVFEVETKYSGTKIVSVAYEGLDDGKFEPRLILTDEQAITGNTIVIEGNNFKAANDAMKERKQKKIQRLSNYLEEHPLATRAEMREHLMENGKTVSNSTLNNYLKELDKEL